MLSENMFGYKNVAIDANVMVNWTILHNLLARQSSEEIKNKILKEIKSGKDSILKKMYGSYNLIENYIIYPIKNYASNESERKFRFLCSNLSLVELYSVLYEEQIYEWMSANFLPSYKIHQMRREFFKHSNLTYADIIKKYEKELNTIIKKIDIITLTSKTFGLSSYLISTYGLSNHDAYIIGEAMRAKCVIFITEDGGILNVFKDEVKLYITNTTKVRVRAMKPQTFINKVLIAPPLKPAKQFVETAHGLEELPGSIATKLGVAGI